MTRSVNGIVFRSTTKKKRQQRNEQGESHQKSATLRDAGFYRCVCCSRAVVLFPTLDVSHAVVVADMNVFSSSPAVDMCLQAQTRSRGKVSVDTRAVFSLKRTTVAFWACGLGCSSGLWKRRQLVLTSSRMMAANSTNTTVT